MTEWRSRSSFNHPFRQLRNRIKELEKSERSLSRQLYLLAPASQLPSMQHSQRLDHRLHMLREEVRTMTREKERGERVWRERLQRCQRQLKDKEEEMSRQSQYFENFKSQLQHKLSLGRDREQSLQNRIYTLEKQLLDFTVSAATGVAMISTVRITAGTGAHLEEQNRLPSMRGEGEGEEERKEERRKQWQLKMETDREERREGDEGKTDIDGLRNTDTKQASNEVRLQGFIISLQEDLRVLLEREEDGMTERRALMEQIQEAQENSHLLGCELEEMKTELHQMKLSESSLLEEVEELKEENEKLQQILSYAANQTPPQPSTNPESTCTSPGTSSPRWSPAVCPASSNSLSTTAIEHSLPNKSGQVQPAVDEGRVQAPLVAVSPVDHQGATEHLQNSTDDCYSSAKTRTPPTHPHDSVNQFYHFGSKSKTNFQSLSFTTESFSEFKLGNLEETPSEESDALREAFRSLGLGEDLEALKAQREHLEVTLQHTQEQLKVMAQENARLKSQLRKRVEEQQTKAEQQSSGEQITIPSIYDGDDHLSSSPIQDDMILGTAQDDLVQALNHENRALADRIQELLAHIEHREEEIKKEEKHLRERISRLEKEGVRLEQENQEQGCLISELTRKTEDDLNTIMDLQQKLIAIGEVTEESKGCTLQYRAQWQIEHTAGKSERFLNNNLEECVDSLVANVVQDDKTQVSQETGSLTTVSSSGCQHNNQNDSSQNISQNSLHVTSQANQVQQLTNSIHSLKTEQDELTGNIHSLREQQREVTLSVQTQTEEKQQLTRTVWTLKEQKDCISQALIDLKQEKEQLSRVVCRLKDERDQFIKSMSGLKEENEQLTKSLSALQRDEKAIIESLSSGKDERDLIIQSLQGLQTESDQLSQTVLHMKQQRDKLTNSLKCLTEQIDQEQLASTSKEEHDRLIKTIYSLKEEKGKLEHSIRSLNQEEKQIMQIVLGLREERNSLQVVPIQTNTEDRNQQHQLLNKVIGGKTKKILAETGDAAPRCETDNHRETFFQQSEPMRKIEALAAELKKSQEELDKSHVESKRLQSELSQSEARREEAEKKAAEQVMRLTDTANQMEDVKKENESLTTWVKELQNKLTGLLREKSDALSLKAQIEEQYNILNAQLKAKTVALEELNSEYIALKRGQGCRDDLGTVLVSLRARYNDIRAKYDALLKRKSQADLDVAPLKAKLSCLVVKCQERNILLAQMLKSMHRQGCMDLKLTQQVEHLLGDAALQDYAAAFTPGSNIQTQDCFHQFTQEFISRLQDYTSRSIPDQTCPVYATSVSKNQNGISPESGDQHGQSEKNPSIFPGKSSTNLKDSNGFPLVDAGTLKKTSPVQDHASVLVSPVVPTKVSMITNTSQLSTPSGPAQSTGRPEKFGSHHLEMKEKSSLDPTGVSESLESSISSSSSTRVSLNRRLSSPEKVLNLHEQLQKTLMSSFQAADSRGRGQQPRRCLSLSVPADLKSPKAKKQNLGLSFTHTHPLPAASSPTKDIPVVTTKPATSNKSATLFNAVACRSANAALSRSMFTNQSPKADVFKTSALSSSFIFPPSATVEHRKDKSISSCGTNTLIPSNQTKKISTVTDIAEATATAPVILNSKVSSPNSTPLALTVSNIPTAPKFNICNMASKTHGADPTSDTFTFITSCQSAQSSPTRRSNMSIKELTASFEKSPRPQTEAPAEVRSVDVIKTVGQSSLLIGWERPLLDELGCSNGTFVYGYRVLVDGDFHKSVMSSACTKCILENLDLSVPVHISVQTLGSNGLRSNSVHTVYRKTDTDSL
ncbi:protein MLP1 homolog [Melanotaenia boesemani]|uniref:protein MLP1 homolog n=1 Tax=Melanotaenia boesemani TaxID=1250792 RepID=UPI001C03FCD4|nr:protein MLP1 homolog [Melanotaenia boesemani]